MIEAVTTRYGFEGDDPKTGSQPAADKQHLAKTVFGREVHLPPKGKKVEHRPPPVGSPPVDNKSLFSPAQRPNGAAGTHLDQRPSSKSSRPGVARFIGRRNTAGNIVPLTQTEVLLPSAWVRPTLTVGAAAVGSFLLVAVGLWIFGPKPTQPSRSPVMKVSARDPALPVKPLPIAPATAAPLMAPALAATAKPDGQKRPHPSSTPKTTRTRASVTKQKKPHDPDAPLPPTFF